MPTRCATGSRARPAGRCTSSAKARGFTSGRRTCATPTRGLPQLRSPPLRAAVPGLRGARTRRAADHLAPAGRATAAACRRAGAGVARLQLHARQRSTSGANWWRCAARCSTSACCSASPATKRRSCRPAAIRPTRCTTCSAARSPACWPRCAGRRPGRPEEAPVTLDERLHALVDEHVRRQRRGPPHRAAPPAGTPAARRSGGLHRRRWMPRLAPIHQPARRDGRPPVRRHRPGRRATRRRAGAGRRGRRS